MISYFHHLRFHKPHHKHILRFLLLHPNLQQRSNLSSSAHHYTSPKPSQDSQTHKFVLNHKDWLSPSEVIKIFNSLEDPNSALDVLEHISKRKDYNPNEALYATVIKKLALAKNFDSIDTVMEKIKLERKCRLSDDFFYNVIKIYGHLGGRINKAIDTLFDMPNYKCWPSVNTFNFVLNLLVSTKQFDIIHEVYMGASTLGIEIDACCLNIIIKGLCQSGNFEAAFKVLDEFPKQNCKPNVRTYSTIMHGLSLRGRVDETFELLKRMYNEGIEVDAITFNIIIKGLRKEGKFDEGVKIFYMMMSKGCDPNKGTYQEMLYCLLEAKKFIEAKEFTNKMMNKRVDPSFESYKLMLDGFCRESDVENVEWVLKEMVRRGFKPKMGMWKQIVQCMVSRSNSCDTFELFEL